MELNDLPHQMRKYNNIEQERFIGACMLMCKESTSQNFQDVWALFETGFKKEGYFVEFGACDGIVGSTTLLLESKYNWNGILAEPNPIWHEKLVNRKASICRKCVWSETGKELTFHNTADPMLGTLDQYTDSDEHAMARKNSQTFTVETITLCDMLSYYLVPKVIDFVSIDTEGSEYDILKAYFDDPRKEKYGVNLFCVEHNYTENREKIHSLMIENGYMRVFADFTRWDDFYRKDKQ